MGGIWIFGILLLGLALYVMMTAPTLRGRAQALPPLYAHRGLHGEGATENGMEAFERACRRCIGIELDVRFTADGEVVVFHDDTLARVCGVDARVDALTLPQLRPIRLPDGGGIPTLKEVLALVAGRVPLLIEVKTGPKLGRLCAAVWEHLRDYAGEYVVESFHPLALRWFKRNAPGVRRGQLVALSDEYLGIMGTVGAFLLSNLLANCLSRPDFVAYDVSMARTFALRVQRKLYRTTLAAWTVRTSSALNFLMRAGQSAIFEEEMGIDPIRMVKGEEYV